MTGGGFGGCTVSLIQSQRMGETMALIAHLYRSATGIAPAVFANRPAQGAKIL
jgi:galactokinase